MATPSSSSPTVPLSNSATSLSAVHHGDAVGERHDLGELGGYEEHGRALVSHREAGSCARTRWRRCPRLCVGCEAMREPGHPSNSRATMSFCWFPPDRFPASTSGSAGLRSCSSMRRSACVADRVEREQAAAGERRAVMPAEDEVLRDGEVQHESALLPVLRNVGDPQVAHLTRRPVRESRCHRPRRSLHWPSSVRREPPRVRSGRCPERRLFPGPHRHAPQDRCRPARANPCVRPPTVRGPPAPGLPGFASSLVDAEEDVPADHHSARVAPSSFPRRARRRPHVRPASP